MSSTHVLTLSCPDRPGLVFAVTGWVHGAGGNILDSQQYTEPDALRGDDVDPRGEFFLRLHVDFGPSADTTALRDGFAPVAAELAMDFRLVEAGLRQQCAREEPQEPRLVRRPRERLATDAFRPAAVSCVEGLERGVDARVALAFHLTAGGRPARAAPRRRSRTLVRPYGGSVSCACSSSLRPGSKAGPADLRRPR